MRKVFLIVTISVVLLAAAGSLGLAVPTGNVEAIVDEPILVPAITPNPGDTNLLMIAVRIRDPGGDAFPTQIDLITIRRTGPSTLDDSAVSNLYLYRDVDDSGTLTVGDQLLGTIANPNLASGATFGIPGQLLIQIPNAGNRRFVVIADLRRNYQGIADAQTLTLTFTARADDNLNPGVASSGFATPFPVVPANAPILTTDFVVVPPGVADVATADNTPAGGERANQSETDVVVQEFTITNPASAGANPAQLDTVTIGPTATNTIPNAGVTAFKLYLDGNASGAFEMPGDLLLSTVNVTPTVNLTNGIQFGTHGVLLDAIVDGAVSTYFIAADFAGTLNEGDVLGVQVNGVTYKDNVVTIPAGVSDDHVAGQVWPQGVAAGNETIVLFASDGVDAAGADIGSDGIIHPANTIGRPVMAVNIADAAGDASATDIEYIWVERRFVPGVPLPDAAIQQLQLYQEDGTTPGWQAAEDTLLGTLAAPIVLNDGVSNRFGTAGQRLLSVANGQNETVYVVGNFDGTALVQGQVLGLQMRILVRDGLNPPAGTGLSSRFVAANSQGVVPVRVLTVSQSAVTVGNVTMTSVGTVNISVNVPAPGLGEMDATLNFNPTIVQVDQVESLNTNYTVVTNLLNNPGGIVRFGCFLSGTTPVTSGAIVRVTLDAIAVGTSVLTLTLNTFRNTNGIDLPQNIINGTATVLAAPPANRGDVNGDGVVDITDARWVAEYAIGARVLTAAQLALADVAPPYRPPDTNVDITDARWIAEAAIGLRTLSIMAAKVGPMALASAAQVAVNEAGQLVVSGSTAQLADLQGRLVFDPAAMTVSDVIGLNGFTVLASLVDNEAGEVRFAAANLSGRMVVEGALLQFVFTGDASQAVLDIDILRDVHARDVPVASGASVGTLEFSNYPNPITDVHTTTFAVKGAGAASVEALKVQIFDLSGRLVYEQEEEGTSLDWHTENDYGEVLANGVYLYKLYARINGEWVASEVKKLAILR